jgi:hypothetical protein
MQEHLYFLICFYIHVVILLPALAKSKAVEGGNSNQFPGQMHLQFALLRQRSLELSFLEHTLVALHSINRVSSKF